MEKPALKEYQSRAISYALKNPYSILALDPGLGKSRCAIEIQQKHSAKCIVICPGYLTTNWQKELDKWAPGTHSYIIKSGGKSIDLSQYNYLIMSYEMAQKYEPIFSWADMVVLDEAHAIKSMTAKRTQFLHRVVFENSIKRLHLLTGTPIKNRVKEFYSLLAICHYDPRIPDPPFLKKWESEIDFADEFAFRKEFQIRLPNGRPMTITQWEGLKNAPLLRQQLINCYIRIRSDDVLDLPPVMYKEYDIGGSDDPELIEAFTNYFLVDMKSKERAVDKDREERTSSTLPEHKAAAALKKVPFTIQYVQNLLEETDCVLVYSDHVKPAQEIAKKFGVEPLTGLMPSDKRARMADDFQNGKSKILVCTIGSMKEGKDLYRSNHIVFNDYGWVPGDMKQVIYRIQRIGQLKHCVVHQIIGSPQDRQIIKQMDQKVVVIGKIT